jgi:hypothetical protein
MLDRLTVLVGNAVIDGYGGGSTPETDVDRGATLPFTGLDLGLLVGGGLTLLAVGYGLRKLARRST